MQIAELQQLVHQFVEGKGWYCEDAARPQTPRNLAISLCLESAEVLEHFQWGEDADREQIALELADVLHYLLQLAEVLDIDLEQAVVTKLAQNQERQW